jgi:hypothetical protein
MIRGTPLVWLTDQIDFPSPLQRTGRSPAPNPFAVTGAPPPSGYSANEGPGLAASATVLRDEDVLGLEVTVEDALGVGGGETPGDLRGVVGDALDRQTREELVAKRLAFEEFGHEVRRYLVRADVVDGDDVRMVERGGGARSVFEASQPIGIGGERRRQNLDRDRSL